MLNRLLLLAAMLLPAFDASAQLRADQATVLITGANRGIGLELARQYAERDWNVIATSRRSPDDPALGDLRALAAAHPNVVIERIDVTDTAMIRAVADKYREQPIDVLLNNAAAVEATFAADMERVSIPYDKIDFDQALYDFNVNTVGPMRMVQAFVGNVARSQRKLIVAMTSMAGNFARPIPGATAMNYSASKAALNKYMHQLSYAVADQGIRVGLFQPNYLVASKPDMQGMPEASPLDEEVGKLIRLIDDFTPEMNGRITDFSTGEIVPF